MWWEKMDKKKMEKWIHGNISCSDCEYSKICDDVEEIFKELKANGLWKSDADGNSLCEILALFGGVVPFYFEE